MMGEGWGMGWGMGGYGGTVVWWSFWLSSVSLSSCSEAETHDPQAHGQRPKHSGCMSFQSNPQFQLC